MPATPDGSAILLLDRSTRPGRTGHRLDVKTAKSIRMAARHELGNSRDDTPTTAQILAAAKCLSALLYDATNGDAKIMVELGGECVSPAAVLSTLQVHRVHR